jgi:uncharacterized protein (TIGR00299 family) protein
MRTGYLECFSGISGDMLLGALVDAGVPFALLEETAALLNVGARLEMRRVSRGGIAGTKVDVITPDQAAAGSTPSHAEHSHEHLPHEHHTHEGHTHETVGAPSFPSPSAERVADHEPDPAPVQQVHTHPQSHAEHRSLSTILSIIRATSLSESVKERAIRAFQLLGEAEAAIHSIPVEKVHFHEVGAVDTIVDIVCTAAGCEALGVDRWLCSPLNVGSGTVECQHGTLPVPAPATLALLGSAPVYAAGPPMERVTPTGAAILRMLNVTYAPLPAMRVAAAGYGAGGRETAGQPNLLRLLVGEEDEDAGSESVAVIETVIDDSTPQLLAYVAERLLEAGAWDVYRASVQMKKGRTGVQLTVLCRPDLVAALRDLIFRETTTIGLRWRLENKVALKREFLEVETTWGEVCIKIARWPSGKIANASPEYEDCRLLATQFSVPLKQVMQEAMRAFEAAEEEGI